MNDLNPSSRKTVVGLGEILWDLLPQGKELGGAVSNFAVMASRLGSRGVIASRVGMDPLGNEARGRLAHTPVDASWLQDDFNHPTGTVTVTLADGQPEYVIHEPVAWDFLEFTPHWLALAEQAHAVCFGTLAQRSPVSRRTVESFLRATSAACVRVFDINLRDPFFAPDTVERSLECATILKLNAAEMPRILALLGFPHAVETTPDFLLSGARLLLDQFPVTLIALTLGEHGSLLVTRSEVHRHPGHPAKIADAVGAGDAFTAALTHYYLQGAPLAVLNEAGNRWGSWTASQAGAMPPLPETTRAAITRQIEEAWPSRPA
jgi:fructokinase